jgi:hypothetical protein
MTLNSCSPPLEGLGEVQKRFHKNSLFLFLLFFENEILLVCRLRSEFLRFDYL